MTIETLQPMTFEFNPWIIIPILLTVWVFINRRSSRYYPDNALAGIGMLFEGVGEMFEILGKIILALVAWVVYFWIF